MKTIEVENDQLLLDIALQQYGTAEAIGEIVRNNPDLKTTLRPWWNPAGNWEPSIRTSSWFPVPLYRSTTKAAWLEKR